MRQALFAEKRAEFFSQLKTDKIHRLKKNPLFSVKINRKKGIISASLLDCRLQKTQYLKYGSWLTNNWINELICT